MCGTAAPRSDSYLVMPRGCGWSRIRQGQIQLVVATLVNTSLPVTEGSTALPQSSVFPRLGVEHRRDSHEFVDAMRCQVDTARKY